MKGSKFSDLRVTTILTREGTSLGDLAREPGFPSACLQKWKASRVAYRSVG
jgi:hypothetical protein